MRIWVVAWLEMIGLLSGCMSPQETIEVSGAVARPGDMAYRTDWTAMDYVQAAGGSTREARLDGALLVRSLADSTEEGTIRSVRFALSDSLKLLPGDVIQIPARTYVVQLDTARRASTQYSGAVLDACRRGGDQGRRICLGRAGVWAAVSL